MQSRSYLHGDQEPSGPLIGAVGGAVLTPPDMFDAPTSG